MQSQNSGPFADPGTPLPDLAVLRVYRWMSDRFYETIVNFDGKRFRLIQQSPEAPQPEPKVKASLGHFNAQRLSLFDSAPLRDGSRKAPLLTVEIRGIESFELKSETELTVQAWVFCFFGLQTAGSVGFRNSEQVLLGLKLTVQGGAVRLDEMKVTDSRHEAKLASMPLVTTKGLDDTADNLGFNISYPSSHNVGHYLTKTIGLKLEEYAVDPDGVHPTPWVMHIDFPRMDEYRIAQSAANSKSNFRTLRFEVKVLHFGKSGASNAELTTFAAHELNCNTDAKAAKLVISPKDFQQSFTITQRAPTSITAIPAPPGFKDSVSNTSLVHVRGVPGKIVPAQWNAFIPEYKHAIDEVLGGRPVSFVPEWTENIGGGWWAFTYQVQDSWDRSGAVAAPPTALRVHSLHMVEGAADFQAQLPKVRSLTNLTISALKVSLAPYQLAKLEVLEFDKGIVLRPRFALAVNREGEDLIAVVDQNTIRMGALDLEVDNRKDHAVSTPNAVYKLQLVPEACRTTIRLNMEIAVKRVLPGGQDDPDGEEYVPENESPAAEIDCKGADKDRSLGAQQQRELTIESRFRRTRPLVIVPSRENLPPATFVLRVTETAEDGRTQTIGLEVGALEAPKIEPTAVKPCDAKDGEGFVDVVVLDHDPFLVAKVRGQLFTAPSLFKGNAIASWSNVPGKGTSWQLRSDNKPFCLVLPPQGVGEEMQKDDATVPDDKRVKYAFTPPGRFELSANVSPANFAEAPWNLRRLLGVAGEPQAGPLLTDLQYELLYGLFCGVQPSGLRLGDIFSRVGRIAPRRAPEMQWKAPEELQGLYRTSRLNWANMYRRYLSRIAVLEPWKPLESQSPVLKTGMKCDLRTGVLANPLDPSSTGLKGGALWGVESLNIYSAVTTNPRSDSAELAGAAFSALGAWGHQKASFNSDLSIINADVAMGRVYQYKLERLGRIGVWWNLAKHVIVYERTVTPTRQFFVEQADKKDGKVRMTNMGRPILRKIREYVEILEENRSYPDGVSGSAVTTDELDAARRRPGFVANCSFPKGAQYNVLGSWGGDVSTDGKKTQGWRVPLWHAGASPSDVYPKPKVTLGLHSRSGDKPVVIPGEIDDPENLYFFTLTQFAGGKPNGDPHAWEPFPDVDFSLLPLPRKPTGDFTGGNLTQTLPDEVPVAAGFGSCSFRLVPALLPSNLTQERSAKPMAAIVKTVTMVRAVSLVAEDSIKVITDIPGSAVAFVQKLVTSLPAAPLGAGDPLPKDIADLLKKNITDPATKVRDGIKNQIGDVSNPALGTLAKRLQDIETDLLNRLKGAVGTAQAEIQKQIADDFAALKSDRQVLKNSMETSVLHKVEDGIALLETSCGAAQRLILRYVEATMALANLLDGDAVRKGITALQGRVKDKTVTLLAVDIDLVRQIRDVENRLTAAGQRRPLDWLPDPTQYILSQLPPLKQLDVVLSAIEAAVAARARAAFAQKGDTGADHDMYVKLATGALEQAASAIQAFKVDEFIDAQVKAAGALLANVTGEAALTVKQDILTAIQQKGHAFETWQARMLAKGSIFDTLRTKVNAAVNSADTVGKIQIDVTAAVNAYFDGVNGVNGVKDDLDKTFKPILDKERIAAMTFLKNSLDSATAELGGIAKDLLDTLKNQTIPVAEIQRQITQLGNDISRRANDFCDKNFRTLLPEGFTPAKIENTAGKAARLVRALGEPPQVPNLDFPRGSLGYYFQDDLKAEAKKIGLTPVLAKVNQAQQIASQAEDVLKSVGITLPTTDLLDSLIPAKLSDFNLSSIFPDFAGLNLSHMFSGLKLPEMDENKVKITHDLDPQTRRATVKADVKFELTESATLFSIGPLVLQMLTANFTATAKIEAEGTTIRRSVNGLINGNWQVSVGGLPVVLFNNTNLRFDDANGVRFEISPANIVLPGVMSFINDLLTVAKTGSSANGLTIGPIEKGYQCVLSLPIPDIQGATTGISNLTLGARLALLYSPKFQLMLGFFLATKEAPFSLTAFILGGGGYLECDATYTPDDGKLTCRVDLAVTASASLAIALGPIKGGVYVYLGITASFRSGGGDNGLTIGALLLIRGNVDILGIVTACVSLMLEATYEGSRFTARGTLSISIKICWCFTLSIHESVEYSLGGSGSKSGRLGGAGPLYAQQGGAVAPTLDPGKCVTQYTKMLV
jgi:hypothetical protein